MKAKNTSTYIVSFMFNGKWSTTTTKDKALADRMVERYKSTGVSCGKL